MGLRRAACAIEDPHHFISCRVPPRAQDPASAVRRFPRKRELPADLVEFRPPPDELLNPIRPFLNEHPHRFMTAQSMPGLHVSVKWMATSSSSLKRDRDPALRKDGIAL